MLRLLGVVALVAVLLYATGVLKVDVSLDVPGLKGERAAATAFWQERAPGEELPEALRLWVALARAVRPAVVNVSTAQRAARGPGGEEFFRRFFERDPGRARTALGSGFVIAPDG